MDGLIRREADYGGDRRADCREDYFSDFGGSDTLWVKVDGRWEVEPQGMTKCAEAMPAALREKFERE